MSSVAKYFDPDALNWPVGLILLVASITILITGYADWLSDEQAIMSTAVRVELWHEDETVGRAAIDAVMAEMRCLRAFL